MYTTETIYLSNDINLIVALLSTLTTSLVKHNNMFMDEFFISIKHGMCAHYVNYCEIPEIAVGLYYINYRTSISCNQSYISLNAF